MNEARPFNNPIEVWVNRSDPEIFFQVREKQPPASDNPHELWVVTAVSPDDGVLDEEAYAETLEDGCVLVWSESSGVPLPEWYRVELPEDAP